MPIQRDRRMKLPRSVCVLVLLLTVAVLGAQAVAAADALVVASGERSGIYPLGKEVVFTITSVEPIDLEEVNVAIVRDRFEKIPSWRTEKDGEGLEVRLTPKAAGWYMCDFTGPVLQRLGGWPMPVVSGHAPISPQKRPMAPVRPVFGLLRRVACVLGGEPL